MEASTQSEHTIISSTLENYIISLEEENSKLKAENQALRHQITTKTDFIKPDDLDQLKMAITRFYQQKLSTRSQTITDSNSINVLRQLEHILAQLDHYQSRSTGESPMRQNSNLSPPFTFGKKNEGSEVSLKFDLKCMQINDTDYSPSNHQVNLEDSSIKGLCERKRGSSPSPQHSDIFNSSEATQKICRPKTKKNWFESLFAGRRNTKSN